MFVLLNTKSTFFAVRFSLKGNHTVRENKENMVVNTFRQRSTCSKLSKPVNSSLFH